MGWKENRGEHSKVWNSAVYKILSALDKKDLQIAKKNFSYEHSWLLERPEINEYMLTHMFVAWIVQCFKKEGESLIPWYLKNHKPNLTEDETAVLVAAHKSIFGIFNVEDHIGRELKLADTGDKTFLVDTVDLPQQEKGEIILTRLNSKGDDRFFLPGPLISLHDDGLYIKLKNHKRFRDSWHKYLKGFFDYQISTEGLTEKTSDEHTENVTLLTFYLETKVEVDSFSKITKPMLKSEFKRYVKQYILGKVDLDRVYYSLCKFFIYLDEEKRIKNEAVLEWLKARI